jgi:PfaB family protein
MKMPFGYALHCDPVVSEYSDLVDLNRWPIRTHPEASLYTASTAQCVQLEEQLVAENIARTLCTCVDFPRLTRQVYEDGSRVFIEMGAGSNCSRWVDETLKGKPHLSISMNRNGQEDSVTIMRSLARLLSHRVPMNLTPLFSTSELVANLDQSMYLDLALKSNLSVRR